MSVRASMTIGMVVVIVILSVFAVIIFTAFFIPGSGLMDKAAKVGNDFSDKYLKSAAEQAKAGKEGSVRGGFESICNSLSYTFSKVNESCLVKYGGMPTNMNKGTLEIIGDGDNIIINMKDETGKQTDTCTVYGKKLCVVAGSNSKGDVAKNFAKNFFTPSTLSFSPFINLDVKSLLVREDGKGFNPGSETNLVFNDKSGYIYENHDNGILFMSDPEHICFFLTQGGNVWDGDCDVGCSVAGARWCVKESCMDNMNRGKYPNLQYCK